MMTPLVLTLKLRSSAPRGLHEVHLDSLLMVAHVRRHGSTAPWSLDRSTPLSDVPRIEIPLLQYRYAGSSCHACTAVGVSADGRVAKWYLYGHRREIRNLLRLLWGREGQAGGDLLLDGDLYEVVKWGLAHSEHELEQCFVSRGRAVRHLPESWIREADRWVTGAHEAPYWHPDNHHELARLGGTASLREDLIRSLRQYDVEESTRVVQVGGADRGPLLAARTKRLDRLTRRDSVEAVPPLPPRVVNGRRYWSDAERDEIRRLRDLGKSWSEIGERFGASGEAVRCQAVRAQRLEAGRKWRDNHRAELKRKGARYRAQNRVILRARDREHYERNRARRRRQEDNRRRKAKTDSALDKLYSFSQELD